MVGDAITHSGTEHMLCWARHGPNVDGNVDQSIDWDRVSLILRAPTGAGLPGQRPYQQWLVPGPSKRQVVCHLGIVSQVATDLHRRDQQFVGRVRIWHVVGVALDLAPRSNSRLTLTLVSSPHPSWAWLGSGWRGGRKAAAVTLN